MRQHITQADLYTTAVCQIAHYGYPRINTWEQLDTPAKLQLHREYLLSTIPERWNREKAKAASGVSA